MLPPIKMAAAAPNRIRLFDDDDDDGGGGGGCDDSPLFDDNERRFNGSANGFESDFVVISLVLKIYVFH